MIITLLIITVTIVIFIRTLWFRNSYLREVRKGNDRTSKTPREILEEKDIEHLPVPVQRYLRYCGVIGKEKVVSAKIFFNGVMKDLNKPEFKIKAEQTSFFDIPTRLFYLKGVMKGVPVKALHKYINAHASFEVLPLSLFHMVNEKEGDLNIAETVTFFNDMCILAPATLIVPEIVWSDTGNNSVRATFSCNGIEISANLFFNEKGQLTNFWSDDRYYLNSAKKMQKVKWSTPVKDYKDYNGIMLASYGEAIWSFQEGDFCYAKFDLKDVTYNSVSNG
jgi:hypothetical protein